MEAAVTWPTEPSPIVIASCLFQRGPQEASEMSDDLSHTSWGDFAYVPMFTLIFDNLL
jgi:hypothetical protein